MSASRAHPRSRGENAAIRLTGEDREGSSPLTRGKPRLVRLTVGGARLIPAHAGKTLMVVIMVSCLWAHPRSRGEN